MQGEQSNEEKLHLEAKIKNLIAELEDKTQTHQLLSLQLKRLQVDVCYIHDADRLLPFLGELTCFKHLFLMLK